jgi:heme A synthase
MQLTRFAKYAWGVLAVNIGVILWGAYVRATGSGAGCGSHWPLCNGEVIPRSSTSETLVEFTHRLSSGLALILILGMFVWAVIKYSRQHIVRMGATLSVILIFTEALVGAGLVLFSWVAKDESLGRVIAMAVHLVNTFLLLAALTLTAWWASGGARFRLSDKGLITWAFGLGLLGVLILGVTGAITALGDTLFPAGSLAQGLSQDFSPTAHFLIRLRVFHPFIALLTGIYTVSLAVWIGLSREDRMARRMAVLLSVIFILQLIAGLINLVLLAPVPMQIIHLLLADLLWISFVLSAAVTLGEGINEDLAKDSKAIGAAVHSESMSI